MLHVRGKRPSLIRDDKRCPIMTPMMVSIPTPIMNFRSRLRYLTSSVVGQIGDGPHARRSRPFRRFSQDFNIFRRNFIEHTSPVLYGAGTVNLPPRVRRLVCSSAATMIVVSLSEA